MAAPLERPMTHRTPGRLALRERLGRARTLRYAAVIAAAVSILVVIERVDDTSREAWTSQAEDIEAALDARYEEPITYKRAYIPADRGVRVATETVIVDGAYHSDCTAELVKDNDVLVDARLVCESPITLTPEPSTGP
ncbi:hypothetical protein [Nocardioides piscis]|uniref:Uncharacterized protein n=1 Tax=Nocardioides piscis TaxID=2714938 RepID=A0A6G7YCA8_9ACTN|nr:hypothetical protein [Nocardioides piscis]QIK74359.1 hypothetical protein G7071_01775 [Nocardioides piscis]